MLEAFTNRKTQFASRRTSSFEPYLFWKWMSRLFLMILLTLLSIWAYIKLQEPSLVPVKEVQIIGTYNHLNKDIMRQKILPYVDKGFFNVDIAALREQLLTDPWVSDATITRVWPYALVIRISEQQPIALWNGNFLLNGDNLLFSPPKETFPNNLPRLNGTEGQQAKVVSLYKQAMNAIASLGFGISEFEITPRQAINLRLTNGLKLVVGKEEVIQRLQRFSTVYPKIVANQEKSVNYIDLRYPNGIAVGWAKEDMN